MFRIRGPERRRRRRRRAPPKDGWLVAELAGLAGVTPRTVRYYVQKGLLAKPTFYGTATRYPRPALVRLLAIQRMQRDEHLPLDAIKKRLGAMPDDAIEAYVAERLAPGPAATALGIARPTPPTVKLDGAERAPSYASVRWDLVQLLPGLSLMVHSEASPLVKKLAQQIYDHCVGAADPAPRT